MIGIVERCWARVGRGRVDLLIVVGWFSIIWFAGVAVHEWSLKALSQLGSDPVISTGAKQRFCEDIICLN